MRNENARGSNLKSNSRLGNLQLLRFFAALLVIIFHIVGNANRVEFLQ